MAPRSLFAIGVGLISVSAIAAEPLRFIHPPESAELPVPAAASEMPQRPISRAQNSERPRPEPMVAESDEGIATATDDPGTEPSPPEEFNPPAPPIPSKGKPRVVTVIRPRGSGAAESYEPTPAKTPTLANQPTLAKRPGEPTLARPRPAAVIPSIVDGQTPAKPPVALEKPSTAKPRTLAKAPAQSADLPSAPQAQEPAAKRQPALAAGDMPLVATAPDTLRKARHLLGSKAVDDAKPPQGDGVIGFAHASSAEQQPLAANEAKPELDKPAAEKSRPEQPQPNKLDPIAASTPTPTKTRHLLPSKTAATKPVAEIAAAVAEQQKPASKRRANVETSVAGPEKVVAASIGSPRLPAPLADEYASPSLASDKVASRPQRSAKASASSNDVFRFRLSPKDEPASVAQAAPVIKTHPQQPDLTAEPIDNPHVPHVGPQQTSIAQAEPAPKPTLAAKLSPEPKLKPDPVPQTAEQTASLGFRSVEPRRAFARKSIVSDSQQPSPRAAEKMVASASAPAPHVMATALRKAPLAMRLDSLHPAKNTASTSPEVEHELNVANAGAPKPIADRPSAAADTQELATAEHSAPNHSAKTSRAEPPSRGAVVSYDRSQQTVRLVFSGPQPPTGSTIQVQHSTWFGASQVATLRVLGAKAGEVLARPTEDSLLQRVSKGDAAFYRPSIVPKHPSREAAVARGLPADGSMMR